MSSTPPADWDKLSITVVRAECKNRGLATTGKKAEMVDRLVKDDLGKSQEIVTSDKEEEDAPEAEAQNGVGEEDDSHDKDDKEEKTDEKKHVGEDDDIMEFGDGGDDMRMIDEVLAECGDDGDLDDDLALMDDEENETAKDEEMKGEEEETKEGEGDKEQESHENEESAEAMKTDDDAEKSEVHEEAGDEHGEDSKEASEGAAAKEESDVKDDLMPDVTKAITEEGQDDKEEYEIVPIDPKHRVLIKNIITNDLKSPTFLDALDDASEFTMCFKRDYSNKPRTYIQHKTFGVVDLIYPSSSRADAVVSRFKRIRFGSKHDMQIVYPANPEQKYDFNLPWEVNQKKPKPAPIPDTQKLVVTNLPKSTSEEMLKSMFSEASSVFRQPRDESKECTGLAVLVFESAKATEEARNKYHGFSIDDGDKTHQLKVFSPLGHRCYRTKLAALKLKQIIATYKKAEKEVPESVTQKLQKCQQVHKALLKQMQDQQKKQAEASKSKSDRSSSKSRRDRSRDRPRRSPIRDRRRPLVRDDRRPRGGGYRGSYDQRQGRMQNPPSLLSLPVNRGGSGRYGGGGYGGGGGGADVLGNISTLLSQQLQQLQQLSHHQQLQQAASMGYGSSYSDGRYGGLGQKRTSASGYGGGYGKQGRY